MVDRFFSAIDKSKDKALSVSELLSVYESFIKKRSFYKTVGPQEFYVKTQIIFKTLCQDPIMKQRYSQQLFAYGDSLRMPPMKAPIVE